MLTQPGASGFNLLHALSEQLHASGWARKSGYLSILLMTHFYGSLNLWFSIFSFFVVIIPNIYSLHIYKKNTFFTFLKQNSMFFKKKSTRNQIHSMNQNTNLNKK